MAQLIVIPSMIGSRDAAARVDELGVYTSRGPITGVLHVAAGQYTVSYLGADGTYCVNLTLESFSGTLQWAPLGTGLGFNVYIKDDTGPMRTPRGPS